MKLLIHFLTPLLIVVTQTSCTAGKKYTKVPFCWTTSHYLSPGERFLTLEASVGEVKVALVDWVLEHEGSITAETSISSRERVSEVGESSFLETSAIASKHWRAIKANRFLEWTDEEFTHFKELMNQQIKKVPVDGMALKIEALMNKRTATKSYRVVVGTKYVTTYSPGVTAYSPSGQAMHIPAYTVRTPVPQYENRTKELPFSSKMQFSIIQESGNTTIIYVYGAPVEEKSGSEAAYGLQLDHMWWSQITGEAEAKLARDALLYLKKRFER